MSSSEDYRRQIIQDLAQGNVESLSDRSMEPEKEYKNFDDFAQRSTREERRQLFGKSLHPDRIPASEIEPELQNAIAQIKPRDREEVAREFCKRLKDRNITSRQLAQILALSADNPKQMNADDVSKLAAYAYHNHPDIFQEVLADKPAIVKFLSNPLVAAVLGVMAAKWLRDRK